MTRSLGPAVFLTVGALFGAQVGGRATRDALFLSSYPFAALPAMIMVTAVFALALAYYSTRFMVRWGPERDPQEGGHRVHGLGRFRELFDRGGEHGGGASLGRAPQRQRDERPQ